MLVEIDHVLQRFHRRVRAEAREVGVQVGLQLVEEHGEFGVAKFSRGFDHRRIDQDRAFLLHRFERFFHHFVDAFVEAEILADHADPRAAKAVGFQELRVVGVGLFAAVGRWRDLRRRCR